MASFLDNCDFNATSTGTVDFVVASAVVGHQTPALAGAVNGAVYRYYARSADLSQWEEGFGAYTASGTTLARATVLFNSSGTGTGAGQSGAGTKITFSTVPLVAIVALAEDLNSPPLPTRYWAGCQHSNNVGTPNTKIDIGVSEVRDSTDTVNIITTAGTIDCTTVGADGLDTGSLAASTKYYTFAIAKAAGASAVRLASTSPTAPTLPSTYTVFRRIGFFKTDASSHILAFKQVNDRWWWTAPPSDLAPGSPTINTLLAATLSVPNVLGVEARIFAFGFNNSGSTTTSIYISPTFAPQSSGNSMLFQYNSTFGQLGIYEIQVDGSGQINYDVVNGSAITSTFLINTIGWKDPL